MSEARMTYEETVNAPIEFMDESELKQEAAAFFEAPEFPKKGFVCDDDQKAAWCLQQIRRAQEEKAFWKEYYKKLTKSAEASCDETIGRMEQFLFGYFKTVPHKHTKTEENYPIPGGKLYLKKQDVDFEYNEADVIQWLKDNKKESFIKIKESLDWQGLKDTLDYIGETVADEDGQVIPCIKAIEREPAFKVQISKKKEG